MEKKTEPWPWTHSLTITVLLLTAIGGTNGFCATAAERQEWLQAHNTYRNMHGVPPVTWSDTLAASAQAWADTCPSGHSGSVHGENIAWASYSMSPAQVVKLWYDEEPLYDYNNPVWNPKAGHFTQVVWRRSTEIGCGKTTGCRSNGKNVWVCQYNPHGNMVGHFAENVLPKGPSSSIPQGSETVIPHPANSDAHVK